MNNAALASRELLPASRDGELEARTFEPAGAPESRTTFHSALARGRDRLDLILNLSTTMSAAMDFRDLLRAIATALSGASQCHWVGIILPDRGTKELRLYGVDTLGAEGEPLEGATVPRSASEAVFRSREPLVADRVDAETFTSDSAFRTAIQYGVRAFCDLPLISRGRSWVSCRSRARISVPFDRTTSNSCDASRGKSRSQSRTGPCTTSSASSSRHSHARRSIWKTRSATR